MVDSSASSRDTKGPPLLPKEPPENSAAPADASISMAVLPIPRIRPLLLLLRKVVLHSELLAGSVVVLKDEEEEVDGRCVIWGSIRRHAFAAISRSRDSRLRSVLIERFMLIRLG